ncbi:hypothetical protein B6N60_02818 [Richelia sinica FACHB-800]|uniref:Uncharacterized protein n=1 Tax=Richelia sinica FACHB-800 TaxID=1357546 RepID=A0A975T8Q8_9NOST|nr:hypothetical protein B6N60_02818 [Richelia sinica FACHB-800]
MATDLTQPPSLVIALAAGTDPSPLILPTQQQINQPVAGFCFLSPALFKKRYFMLRCNNTIGRKVSAELAT